MVEKNNKIIQEAEDIKISTIQQDTAKDITNALEELENIEFDEEWFYDFEVPSTFDFIEWISIDEEDYKEWIIKITFRDGYLADFISEDIAEELDEYLHEIDWVEEVYWEDREYFHITHDQTQTIMEMAEKIEDEMNKLSRKK